MLRWWLKWFSYFASQSSMAGSLVGSWVGWFVVVVVDGLEGGALVAVVLVVVAEVGGCWW